MHDTAYKSENNSILNENSFKTYLHQIQRYPILNKEEEIKLGILIQKGNKTAINTLVKSNLRFVIKLALKFYTPRMPLMDLISEGNIGLIKAARKYNPKHKVRFLTYAYYWIRQEMFIALANNNFTVRLPIKRANLSLALSKYKRNFHKRNGKEPSFEEILSTLEDNPKVILHIIRLSQNDISLDNMSCFRKKEKKQLFSVYSNLKWSHEDIFNSRLKKEVKQLITTLSKKEAAVITIRFGLDDTGEKVTLQEIGNRLGLTKEGARRIEMRAINKLKKICMKPIKN